VFESILIIGLLMAGSFILGLTVHKSVREKKVEQGFALLKTDLKPGDILVLHYEGHLSEEGRMKIRELMKKEFPGRLLIVLEDGMRLEVIDETSAAEHENHGGETNEKH
jgi:hypothetical protein